MGVAKALRGDKKMGGGGGSGFSAESHDYADETSGVFSGPELIRASTSHRVGSNRLSRLPSFAPEAAGFWRAPVQIKDLEKSFGSRSGQVDVWHQSSRVDLPE